MKLLLLFLLTASAFATAPLQIFVGTDQSFRGPFTDAPAALSGETVVTLTDAQAAQLHALRVANPTAAKFAFDGTNFILPSIEQLRAALRADFARLSPGEQLLFKPQFDAVKILLDAGNVPEARVVINLSGVGMPQAIADARTAMLADIDRLFPPSP